MVQQAGEVGEDTGVSGSTLAKLEGALASFLGEAKLTTSMARVLDQAVAANAISYGEIGDLVHEDPDEVVLAGFGWRLLIPTRSMAGTLEWATASVLLTPDETYRVPNAVRHGIAYAREAEVWAPDYAVARAFEEMGEPAWEQMPVLVKYLTRHAKKHMVTSTDITRHCEALGLGDRVGVLISELKGAGIISPRVSVLTEAIRSRVPTYEMNPSLCPR